MLRFEKEYKIIEVGGVKLIGQLGDSLTLLIITIFCVDHKIISDRKNGFFDK